MFRLIQRHDSLAKRILLLAFTTISLSVMLTGGIIAWSFGKFQERSVRTYHTAYIDILIAATNVSKTGTISLSNIDIFERMPFYWQITSGNTHVKKSPLLKEWLPESTFQDRDIQNIAIGEHKTPISFVQKTLTFPGNIKVSYMFGIPADIISALFDQEKQRFTLVLLTILTVLAFMLISIIAFVQVRASTRPLTKIKQEIMAIHEGKKQTLQGGFPKEISVLANEINKLLSYNIAIIERYRTFAANLSHSLKTPLTVVYNESQKSPGVLADIVQEQTSEMLGIIDRNLTRVNAAGKAMTLYGTIDVAVLTQKITQSFTKLYDKKMDWANHAATPVLKGNEADVYEIFGNIIENACKYSASVVRVSITNTHNTLCITVEDDGPGIPAHEYTNVLKHGTRLDKAKPGYGVGLAVAHDIIQLYSGELVLSTSDLGGLKVQLVFPNNT